MRRGLAVASLILLLASRASADDKQIDEVSPADFHFGAMAIGQAKDVDYARAEALGLVPATPLDAYLNGVLAKLVAQSPVRNVPAHVYVRASGDWAAKTTADANIYVALGTLLRLDSEDEVAALLAHEASHVILGHADADVVQSTQQRAIQLTSLALETRDLVNNAGKTPAAKAKGGGATEEQTQALLLNTMLIVPAWTREQEHDADLLGTDLLVRAGYSPQAVVSLLRKQQQFESERAIDPKAQQLDKQLAVFGVDVDKETQKQAAKIAKNTGAKDDLVGSLLGAGIGKVMELGSKQVGEAQRSHPKTSERIVEAEGYISSEYSDSAGKAVQVESWEAAKEKDGTVDVLENYIAAIDAKGKLADGDVAAARKLAKTSLSGPTRAHAYPNYVEAAVEIAGGNSAPAIAAYETALAGPEPAGAIYSEASALYLETGKSDKAREVIEAGYARLQEPPSLTVPLIATYHALGRQADADRVATQCAARWPQMQKVCAEARDGKTK